MISDVSTGIYLDNKSNGTRYCNFMLRFFDFAILDNNDISQTIRNLSGKTRQGEVIAKLSKARNYQFNGSSKGTDMSFGLLYDFVDSFIITDYDDLDDDIDSLINLRMYNDEYKPIFLEVKSSLLYEELDEILAYSMLSNIDGLYIKNHRLLKYAVEKANGNLSFISEIPENYGINRNEVTENCRYCIPACTVFPPFTVFKLWNIRRKSAE